MTNCSKVYVIMANDFPIAVFDDSTTAYETTEKLNKLDADQVAAERGYKGRRVYYQWHVFELNVKQAGIP